MNKVNGRGRNNRYISCVVDSCLYSHHFPTFVSHFQHVFSPIYDSDTNRPVYPKMMMQQQDQTIDTIAGTLSTLAEQAGLMGREIHEHNEYVSFIPSPPHRSCVWIISFSRNSSHFLNALVGNDRMLDDLEQNVDKSDAKLSSAMSRMKKFIRQTEGPYTLFVLETAVKTYLCYSIRN